MTEEVNTDMILILSLIYLNKNLNIIPEKIYFKYIFMYYICIYNVNLYYQRTKIQR